MYACVLDYSAVEEATAKLTLRKVIAEGQRDAGVSERVSFVVARVREKKRESKKEAEEEEETRTRRFPRRGESP